MKNKLPVQAEIFINHLEIGLDCFDLNFAGFKPFYLHHDKFGVGCSFSQVKPEGHSTNCIVKNSLIISGEGLHFTDEKLLPFSNEQPPTHLALLVLSAIVKDSPLQFICEECDA